MDAISTRHILGLCIRQDIMQGWCIPGSVLAWQWCGVGVANIWAHFLQTPQIYHRAPFPLEIIVTSLDWAWSLHYQSYHSPHEERERGVRCEGDISCYREEYQLSSQIAVITHSLIETHLSQLVLHVDRTHRHLKHTTHFTDYSSCIWILQFHVFAVSLLTSALI